MAFENKMQDLKCVLPHNTHRIKDRLALLLRITMPCRSRVWHTIIDVTLHIACTSLQDHTQCEKLRAVVVPHLVHLGSSEAELWEKAICDRKRSAICDRDSNSTRSAELIIYLITENHRIILGITPLESNDCISDRESNSAEYCSSVESITIPMSAAIKSA